LPEVPFPEVRERPGTKRVHEIQSAARRLGQPPGCVCLADGVREVPLLGETPCEPNATEDGSRHGEAESLLGEVTIERHESLSELLRSLPVLTELVVRIREVKPRGDLQADVIDRLELTKSGRRREVPLNAESYDALVTLNPKASGRVLRTKSVRKAYENAVTNARLDDANFHTLRHTFASRAVVRGVSLKELQELLGHSSLAMTMRYAHLAPERLRSAVTRLEGLTSSKPAEESAQA
jgi:hypothetical protein